MPPILLSRIERAVSSNVRHRGAEYARKLAGRPEGLAVFYRRTSFDWINTRVIPYNDGAGVTANSGYVAQLVLLRHAEKILGVINTHLTWDPPTTAREAQRGLRQVQQCLAEYQNRNAEAHGWLINGDFNVTPESEIVALALRAGMSFGAVPHAVATHALTIGGIGGLTLGMMTRTARGHTGRPLQADPFEVTCYALIMLAAVIRVFGGMSWADQYLSSVVVSGVCWSLAFATYAVRYWPVLTQPRIDGKPG